MAPRENEFDTPALIQEYFYAFVDFLFPSLTFLEKEKIFDASTCVSEQGHCEKQNQVLIFSHPGGRIETMYPNLHA